MENFRVLKSKTANIEGGQIYHLLTSIKIKHSYLKGFHTLLQISSLQIQQMLSHELQTLLTYQQSADVIFVEG